MRKSRKLKLFTMLSTLATITAATATACSSVTQRQANANEDEANEPVVNAAQDITILPWYKRTTCFAKDPATNIQAVKDDNINIIKSYPGIDTDCTWSAVFNSDNNTVSLHIEGNYATFTGSVDWAAKYIDPTPPEPTPEIEEHTYAELKEMKDNNQLQLGKQYRLTDYVCTVNGTSSSDPYYNIARASTGTFAPPGHASYYPFDMILSTTTSSGKIIFSNDVTVVKNEQSSNDIDYSSWKVKYCFDENDSAIEKHDWAVAPENGGKGVIFYMKDEFNNEAPYDFKNIAFKHGNTGTEGRDWMFTFNGKSGDNNDDASSWGDKVSSVHDNKIGQYYTLNGYTKTLSLNNIVFFGGDSGAAGWEISKNTIGICSHDITTGINVNTPGERTAKSCVGLTIGENCKEIHLGWGCYGNVFGVGCSEISAGNDFQYNNFGAGCSKIKFIGYNSQTPGDRSKPGDANAGNVFGDGCSDITFYNPGSESSLDDTITRCSYNTFGRDCWHIETGYGFSNNTFGNNCGNDHEEGQPSLKFGSFCANNTFNDSCNRIKLGNHCIYNEFSKGCEYINIAITSDGNLYSGVSSAESIKYNTFGPGCGYIDVVFNDKIEGEPPVYPAYPFRYNTFRSTQGSEASPITFDQTTYEDWDAEADTTSTPNVHYGYCNHSWSNNKEDSTSIISKTYEELWYLYENHHLVPGQQYRITDYETKVNNATSAKYENKAQVANKQFDIIVEALDNSRLNADAKAINHVFGAGDTDPFEDSNLSEWEIKYDINNKSSKYDWAVEDDGKGVIYYMKDEFNNECPYDFKNIQFNWGTTDPEWYYTFSKNDDGVVDSSLTGGADNVYGNVIKPANINGGAQVLNMILFDGIGCYSNTFGNDCKNIRFVANSYNNILGSSCLDMEFATASISNQFENNCSNIQFKPATGSPQYLCNRFGAGSHYILVSAQMFMYNTVLSSSGTGTESMTEFAGDGYADQFIIHGEPI